MILTFTGDFFMKPLASSLQNAFSTYIGAVAYCVELKESAGAEYRFTSHFMPVLYDGAVYEPVTLPLRAAESASFVKLTLHDRLIGAEEAFFALAFADSAFLHELSAPLAVKISLVAVHAPEPDGVLLFSGVTDQIHSDGVMRLIRCVSDKSALDRVTGRSVHKICSAIWGDRACGVNRAAYAFTLQITEIMDEYSAKFTLSAGSFPLRSPAPYAEINGRRTPVQSLNPAGAMITFAEAVSLTVGQSVICYPGCDGSFSACIFYANAVNFRGFPFTPRKDIIAEF
jgi:uncharacterized phage protein (TIGR02218 family)